MGATALGVVVPLAELVVEVGEVEEADTDAPFAVDVEEMDGAEVVEEDIVELDEGFPVP